MKHYERVCAYIDLDAILHNMDCMKKNIAKDTKIVAVIKTDGYGHGAVRLRYPHLTSVYWSRP